jgi:hypothetical protein
MLLTDSEAADAADKEVTLPRDAASDVCASLLNDVLSLG